MKSYDRSLRFIFAILLFRHRNLISQLVLLNPTPLTKDRLVASIVAVQEKCRSSSAFHLTAHKNKIAWTQNLMKPTDLTASDVNLFKENGTMQYNQSNKQKR